MQKEFILLGIIAFVVISITPAFASNGQVNIINSNSTKDCSSIPSCYVPYQVTISVGGTVTWTNLDNKTHTATAGTSNYGPVGNFDSGFIESGKSFTQFFGTVGKYRYFDKINPWVTGIVIVESGKPTHAELTWVTDSLKLFDQFGITTTNPVAGKSITMTKNVTNSGETDANSIIFRLKIKNGTNFLAYDNIVKVNIGAKQTVSVSFSWAPQKAGNYYLTFDADPSNPIGDTNENDDLSYDILTISNGTVSMPNQNIPKINATETSLVPEFGSLASVILAAAITSIIILSTKARFRS